MVVCLSGFLDVYRININRFQECEVLRKYSFTELIFLVNFVVFIALET